MPRQQSTSRKRFASRDCSTQEKSFIAHYAKIVKDKSRPPAEGEGKPDFFAYMQKPIRRIF